MLTIANYENETASWNLSQNEIQMSDREILQRVNRIRSGWSVEERVQRRREAERRFADLINALSDSAAA